MALSRAQKNNRGGIPSIGKKAKEVERAREQWEPHQGTQETLAIIREQKRCMPR